MNETLCVLIADDEPLARQTLRDFLGSIDGVGEIREVADGPAAVTLIDAWQPDLVFLDIIMPGLTGIEVLTRVTHEPCVVFTTAYDEHAIAAFELGALDYVLKPFGRERLLKVVSRARAMAASSMDAALDRARAVLAEDKWLSRVFVRDGARIVNLDLSTVESIDGGDDHAAFRVAGREFLVKVRLREVATKLDPARFARIHRCHIVNLDFVAACEPYDAWRLQAVMKNGRRIVASRAGTRLLKALVLG